VIDKKSRCWRLVRSTDPTFELTYRDTADEQARQWEQRSGELRELIEAYDSRVKAERPS